MDQKEVLKMGAAKIKDWMAYELSISPEYIKAMKERDLLNDPKKAIEHMKNILRRHSK